MQNKFNEDKLLPGGTLRSVYVAGWITSYGTKCERVALVPYDVGHAAFLPKFGKKKQYSWFMVLCALKFS